MLVLEVLRAKFGDSLLLHFGTKAKPPCAKISITRMLNRGATRWYGYSATNDL